MKRILNISCVTGALALSCLVTVNPAYAQRMTVRSVKQFDNLIADTPMSVVIFFDKSQRPHFVETIVDKASRTERFKCAGLRFFTVDRNRLGLCELFERYGVNGKLPRVQVFLRTQPMRNAFMEGEFTKESLCQFVERFLGRALTTEVNHKKVRKELARSSSQRGYYAADYYNPFYMMPWYNYTPPSDWPDQGPEWIGIEVD